MSPTHARSGAEQPREGEDEMDSVVGGFAYGARGSMARVHERTAPADSVIL